jgi:hypothetical protein
MAILRQPSSHSTDAVQFGGSNFFLSPQSMRRKVIQNFANVFCQRLLDLPDGHDVASFAHYGSGTFHANVLTGECSFNSKSIPNLRLCDTYRDWLREQSEKHRVPYEQIVAAAFEVRVVVKDVNLRSSYGHLFASAHFFFECRSEIKTDEKSYVGQMAGDKKWGFDWYYERLYGALPDVWPTTTC